MPAGGLLPAPDQLEAFFAPLREPWGVRHGAMDAATLLLLALLRWVAIVQVCPFLGGRLVPGTVKIGLALLFGWFTVPAGLQILYHPARLAGVELVQEPLARFEIPPRRDQSSADSAGGHRKDHRRRNPRAVDGD